MNHLLTALAILVTGSGTAYAQVAAKKTDSAKSEVRWYGSIEARHHLNTYYDENGDYHHQEPSFHTRLQAGAQFYSGKVDLYGTLGVYKKPMTQQLLARRPEVSLDFRPVNNPNFTLLQYTIVQFPVKYEDQFPDDRDEIAKTPSTIVLIGLSPVAKLPVALEGSKLEFRVGADGWTQLYSQKQYTSDYTYEDDDAESPGLTLDEPADEPVEDFAPHYRSQVFGLVAYNPAFMKGVGLETSAHSQSRFDPRYTRDPETDAVTYEYGAERYSFYKVRVSYEIDEQWSVSNDFYHFHGGFFESSREGEDRRYRNIARLTCRL